MDRQVHPLELLDDLLQTAQEGEILPAEMLGCPFKLKRVGARARHAIAGREDCPLASCDFLLSPVDGVMESAMQVRYVLQQAIYMSLCRSDDLMQVLENGKVRSIVTRPSHRSADLVSG
jgi:hypothetical protein